MLNIDQLKYDFLDKPFLDLTKGLKCSLKSNYKNSVVWFKKSENTWWFEELFNYDENNKLQDNEHELVYNSGKMDKLAYKISLLDIRFNVYIRDMMKKHYNLTFSKVW